MSFELQSVLSQVIQQLAEFFGTTVDAISANMPDWLAKYGQFCVYSDAIEGALLGLLAATLIGSLIFLFTAFCLEIDHPAFYITTGAIILIIGLVIGASVPFVKCHVSPELYGLQKLMELIGRQ